MRFVGELGAHARLGVAVREPGAHGLAEEMHHCIPPPCPLGTRGEGPRIEGEGGARRRRQRAVVRDDGGGHLSLSLSSLCVRVLSWRPHGLLPSVYASQRTMARLMHL
jgi:hypothetical protein